MFLSQSAINPNNSFKGLFCALEWNLRIYVDLCLNNIIVKKVREALLFTPIFLQSMVHYSNQGN